MMDKYILHEATLKAKEFVALTHEACFVSQGNKEAERVHSDST
jgi:hypothetical protein